MATLVMNQDKTLTVTLSLVEQDTVARLPAGQLEQYVTLWLRERATQVFNEQFQKLSPQDQADILEKFRGV